MPNTVTLDMEHPGVQYLCKKDKRLAKVISMVGPITYNPESKDSYRFLIHEIIEQMLSVKTSAKIYNRLEQLCSGNITPEKIQNLTDDEIRGIGTSNAKVKYIRNLTNAVLDGSLSFDRLKLLSDREVITELTKLRGIGNWTAKMYLIFVLNRPDILPFEDGAFLQSYRWVYKTEVCHVSAICKKWSPYASIASRFFYRALDAGMTKTEFHLFK